MSVLCMPVCNYEEEVIGVAEIINKKNGTKEFTQADVEVCRFSINAFIIFVDLP